MIPIVEDYLSELITSRLSFLSTNPSHVQKILGTSQQRLDKLQNFLSTKEINVIKGFPRTPAELPSICILLSNEEENQEGLGDYEVTESMVAQQIDTVGVINTTGAKLALPYIELTKNPLQQISSIQVVSTGEVIDSIDYEVEDYALSIVYFYIDMPHGEQLKVTYSYENTTSELTQVMYEASYRLEVWANNADLVVDLYHLLKWALLWGRDKLANDNHLYRQKLSGSDFQPAPNYFPEFVYRRSLSFWCQFSASASIRDVGFITGAEVDTKLIDGGVE